MIIEAKIIFSMWIVDWRAMKILFLTSYSTVDDKGGIKVIGASLFHASASKIRTAFFISLVISAYNWIPSSVDRQDSKTPGFLARNKFTWNNAEDSIRWSIYAKYRKGMFTKELVTNSVSSMKSVRWCMPAAA